MAAPTASANRAAARSPSPGSRRCRPPGCASPARRSDAERAVRGRHLVARFGASLRAREPAPADVERVRRVLTGPEFEVWAAMSRADRAESLATWGRLPADIAADDRWAA